MANKPLIITEAMHDYVDQHTRKEPEIMQALRLASEALPDDVMRSSYAHVNFLLFILKLIQAENIIEVGVFTGYTTLAMALTIPNEGRIIACDVDDDYVSVGKPFWQQAGVSDKIDLRLSPAKETLQLLIEEGHSNTIDFIFIDADKPGYLDYYEQAIKLLKRGGVVAVDNTLLAGKVISDISQGEAVSVMRDLNKKIAEDDRVSMSFLPIADGLTLVRKL